MIAPLNLKFKLQAKGAAETPLKIKGLVPVTNIQAKYDLHMLLQNREY